MARDLGVSQVVAGHWVRRAKESQLLSEPKTLALETPEGENTLELANPVYWMPVRR